MEIGWGSKLVTVWIYWDEFNSVMMDQEAIRKRKKNISGHSASDGAPIETFLCRQHTVKQVQNRMATRKQSTQTSAIIRTRLSYYQLLRRGSG